MNSVLLLKSEGDSSEERFMDELGQLPSRVARLEADVDHIKVDVADIKVDIRRLDDRMRGFEERVNAKFDAFEERVSARFDGVSAKFDSFDQRLNSFDQRLNAKIDANRLLAEAGLDRVSDKIEALQREFSSAKIWALGLYIGLAASMLLVMAKGFKWI